jgi:hypothetical protein
MAPCNTNPRPPLSQRGQRFGRLPAGLARPARRDLMQAIRAGQISASGSAGLGASQKGSQRAPVPAAELSAGVRIIRSWLSTRATVLGGSLAAFWGSPRTPLLKKKPRRYPIAPARPRYPSAFLRMGVQICTQKPAGDSGGSKTTVHNTLVSFGPDAGQKLTTSVTGNAATATPRGCRQSPCVPQRVRPWPPLRARRGTPA